MSRPHIHLAFTDDWELPGDGSGDARRLQFEPMRRLREIFDKHGVRTTFMTEVMQQLAFRAGSHRHPELGRLADEWDECVIGAYRGGHDIQPHVHTQWSRSRYDDGRWTLESDWSILNYHRDEAEQMLGDSINYLTSLLNPVDPEYRCVAFRAGSSVIAPSPFILGLLSKLGIVFDLSIVGGLRVNTRRLAFDYTDCEEDFLPFYPEMSDARRVSDKREPLICVPIFHFTGSRRAALRQITGKVSTKLRSRKAGIDKGLTSTAKPNDWAELGRESLPAKIYDKVLQPVVFGKHLTADIGQLDFGLLREMLAAIRRRAETSGIRDIPIILTNHSKYIRDYNAIERFVGEVAAADDIETITLTEIASGLMSGKFAVRHRGETRVNAAAPGTR